MHVKVADIVFAVAASPDIDHPLDVALDMLVNVTTQFHRGSARFLKRVFTDPASAAREGSSHRRVRS
jgi:hypothetical protein